MVKLASKKGNHLEGVGEINYLKWMKREIFVEIWLKLANGNRREAGNQKQVCEWYPKEATTSESQENS